MAHYPAPNVTLEIRLRHHGKGRVGDNPVSGNEGHSIDSISVRTTRHAVLRREGGGGGRLPHSNIMQQPSAPAKLPRNFSAVIHRAEGEGDPQGRL